MKKPPAFQFYAKDWLTSKAVLAMTPAQCGYYINLLAHAWDSELPGTLPNDPDILWKLARADSLKKFNSESVPVLAQFGKTHGGKRLTNRRLRGYWNELKSFSVKQSRNGKHGGAPRGNKNADKTTQKQPKTSSSSSSSSSSLNLNLKPQNPGADAPPPSPRRFEGKTGRDLVIERILEHGDHKKELADREKIHQRDRRLGPESIRDIAARLAIR